MTDCEHDENWIEDKRDGLHCCLCERSHENDGHCKLYANNLHYVVCDECLPMIKQILSSQKKKALSSLKAELEEANFGEESITIRMENWKQIWARRGL